MGVSSRSLCQWIMILVLGLTGGIIYSNTLNSPFVLDDYPFILEDRNIHLRQINVEGLVDAAVHGFPPRRWLPNLSFALNYYAGQINVKGYHWVNIGIHVLNGLVLFFFFQITLSLAAASGFSTHHNRMISFFAALLWLVHPVATQSVTYICQRMTSMAALFYMLSLLMYAHARTLQRSIPRGNLGADPHPGSPPSKQRASRLWVILLFLGCALCSLAAMVTKENAGMLPVFILLYEWFFFQDLKIKWSYPKIIGVGITGICFVLVGLAYLGVNPIHRILQGYAHREFTLLERVMTEWRVVIYYLSLMFFAMPGRLNLDHDYPLSESLIHPFSTLIALSAILGLAAVLKYAARKDRLLSFCILWFLGNLVIESTIIGIEIIFEHRTYLPLMMLFLLGAVLLFRHMPNTRSAVAVVSACVIIFSFWTYQRNSQWQNDVVLSEDIISKSPYKARGYANLGLSYLNRGIYEKALLNFYHALSIFPRLPQVYNNIGVIHDKHGRYPDAILWYKKALAVDPANVFAHYNLGLALIHMDETDEGISHLLWVAQKIPHDVNVRIHLGNALSRQGRYAEAMVHYQAARRVEPDNEDILNNIGNTHVQLGNMTEAIRYYALALDKNPKLKSAQRNLEAVINGPRNGLKEGDPYRSLHELVDVYPRVGFLYYLMARLSSRQNDPTSGLKWLKKAAENGYDNWDQIRTEPDLEPIRNMDEFRKWIQSRIN